MEKLKKMFRSASSRNGAYSIGLIVIVAAIAVAVNLVVGQLPENIRSIDISDNRIYEISDVSKKALEDLDQKVKLTVIAELDSVDARIETFVKKYAAMSSNLEVEWIDSVLHPSVLQEYETEGNVIVVSCEDTGKTTTISFNDIIQYDSYTYYMSGQISETEFDGEGQLTSAVNYVTSDVTKKIYLTGGHGEGSFSTSVSELFGRNNMTTEEINLSMDARIPDDCDLLFLYAPTSDITEDENALIKEYLKNGGKVYLILSDEAGETPYLDDLMAEYGLEKADGYIADTQRSYQGNYYAIFPQLSLADEMGSGIENEMVLLLNSMGMRQADVDSDTLVVSPFMETSSEGYAVTEDDQVQGQFILGAYATDTVKVDSEDEEAGDEEDEGETKEARLTVLASDSMIDPNITEQLTTLDNLTLFVNSVTANFDDIENIAIEPKSLSIEQNTPMYAGGISLVVIFVIPAAIVLIGFAVWMRRRKA